MLAPPRHRCAYASSDVRSARHPSPRRSRRGADAMALNDRYLNPQLGRIVRTLGFDREWVRGEGAHLIDAQGNRYLDLLCGYGTFAVGRNHPDVIAELHALLDAHSANLPQLGVSLLPGRARARRSSSARRSGSWRWCRRTPAPRRSRARSSSRAPRPAARAILYAEHAFHGLTLGSLSLNGDENFREGFGPFVPGCERVAVRRSRCAARRARAPATSRRSSSSRSRARASTSLPRAISRPRRRSAASTARCSSATRSRPASGAPGASSRSSTGASTRT